MVAEANRGVLPALFIVVCLNLLAHFIPFERVSLAGDDIQYLTIPPQERWEYVRSQTEPPAGRCLEICYIVLHWVVGDHPALWVVPVFLTSSLLAGCVYLLMRRLIGDPVGSLLCSVLYVLLPNKVQLYHHLVYAHIHAVLAFTAVSFLFFLAYLRSSKRVHLLASVACYSITIFWYELGYFLPLVLAVAAFPHGKRKLGACLLFLVPVVLNVLWRSGVFSDGNFHLYPVYRQALHDMTFWDNLYGARKLFVGREMQKWILCGLARFPAIGCPWLLLLVVADQAVLWGFFRWFRKRRFPAIPLRLLPVSIAMVLFFLAPAALGGELLGRHAALADIGFCILAVMALRFLAGSGALLRFLLTALLGVGLVVSQGLAWSQVVSCRMNRAILETLREQGGSLTKVDQIVIDQYSLAQRIPSSWVKDPRNCLDSYWGVDGLLGENFRGVILWVTGKRIPLEIIRSDQWRVPREETLLIDYAAVYAQGFYDGRRSPDR